MSRIHEALRKAEQERASNAAVGRKDELPAINTDALSSSPVAPRNGKLFAPTTGIRDVMAPPSFEVLASRCVHLNWRLDPQVSLVDGGESETGGAERFRTLRSRLFQIAATRPLRRVLITSSLPAEGKSFIAANLAQSLACRQDSRVLLIDGDLRAPRLHLALCAPKSPGLTNCVRGETDEFSVIQIGAQSNLAFLPSGDAVADPCELILGGRVKKLLDFVTPAFDWVILDSPPALAVHDPSLFADLCDGVLFVVKAGETSYENAVKGSSEFREKNLLGVVLNQIQEADMYAGDYYYGKTYGRTRK